VNNFETNHTLVVSDARNMDFIADESVDLIVTSPPYPMIQMWDTLFSSLSSEISEALHQKDGNCAFNLMHEELDKVWSELYRILKPGSFACINIGDATRKIEKKFKLYTNHSRIISSLNAIGFDSLPAILWRKQTNAPNKFMGSGMLPSGAYVTLEHEYILIFRKGNKKEFKTEAQKKRRMESAFFWEERNIWFSDIWDFKGIRQKINHKNLRDRSAAFPFELAFRLVNMYSLYDDVVLDPFAGIGTTLSACIACCRNSIGIDIDKEFISFIKLQAAEFLHQANTIISDRINSHHEFIKKRIRENRSLKYKNNPHGFKVMTKQETEIQLRKIISIKESELNEIAVFYKNWSNEI